MRIGPPVAGSAPGAPSTFVPPRPSEGRRDKENPRGPGRGPPPPWPRGGRFFLGRNPPRPGALARGREEGDGPARGGFSAGRVVDIRPTQPERALPIQGEPARPVTAPALLLALGE